MAPKKLLKILNKNQSKLIKINHKINDKLINATCLNLPIDKEKNVEFMKQNSDYNNQCNIIINDNNIVSNDLIIYNINKNVYLKEYTLSNDNWCYP